MMIAQVCDMKAGELLHVIADAHIYDRHIPLVEELISREHSSGTKGMAESGSQGFLCIYSG